ncbi:MAG TPA: CehA/McbA family metallohydrolase, partial [Gemmatimonadales bacterium]|nr:CehA/McbA family metallohydrolase [Gemmatimonadales bacterium]
HAGYAYPPSGGTLAVPEGWSTVHVSRGPEWTPWSRRVWIGRDTTVNVALARFHDLRARNFYASDLHVHTRHDPVQFTISPGNAKRIAKAEDLAVLHLLDQEHRFTGSPDAESDAQTIVYHSWEHRHQTYGHVSLPGLRANVPWGCCLAPDPAWPLLQDLARQVAGPGRALFVLAHPGSSDDFHADKDWPGTGLGREYPLLAARGLLNGFDVVSYSNLPHERWQDWYDALSAGIALTPTAGTDALLDVFDHRPAGGWRVYADMGSSTPFTYDNWIEIVRAGRTFVTSLPLIPRFRVSTRRPGEKVEAAADTTSFAIEIEARCVTGLTQLHIVSSAGTLWSLDLGLRSPVPTRFDTTFTLRRATPGWMALKVHGVGGDRVLLGLPAVAHTNAVRIWRNGAPRLEGGGCGRMLDRVDD